MNSSQREPGKEHIPNYPKGFIALRILQLVFAVIVVGLSAYSVAVWAFTGDVLILFTSLITMIISIWLISAHSCAPGAFNYWAALFFDAYLYIFWLSAFALLASEAALLFGTGYVYCYDYDECDSYDLEGVALTWASIKAAAAGLGAIEFVLYFVSLVLNAIAIYRHRRAGLHNRPVRRGAAMSDGAAVGYQMQFQNKPDYQALPPQGTPYGAQGNGYSTQGIYNQGPPQGAPVGGYGPQIVPQFQGQQQPQQGFYPQQQQQPLAAQHTGGSFNKPVSPAAAQGPYNPPSPAAAQGPYSPPSPATAAQGPYNPPYPQQPYPQQQFQQQTYQQLP